MADIGTLLMKVEADTSKFESGIKRSKESFAKMTKALAVGAVAATAALGAIGAKSIALAMEQEKADARLEAIAKKVTKATDAQVQSLKNLAAAQQKVSTFGDEVLISGQSQLLSYGLQTDQVEDLTGSLADLLAANNGMNASQEDAINAANMLGKAFSGQVGALSKAGILLDETQAGILQNGTASEKTAALVEIMNQNYGGLAETLSQTSEGQMIQMKNALGDIGEKIGQFLIPWLNKMVSFISDNMPTIEKITVGTFEFIGKAMSVVSDFVQNYVIPAFNSIKEFWESNGDGITSKASNTFDTIVTVATNMWNFFSENILPIFETFYTWVIDNMPMIKETVQTAFDGIILVATNMWNFFSEYILPVLQSLWDLWVEISPAIKTLAENAFNGVITVAKALWEVLDATLIPIIKLMYEVVGDVIPKLTPIFETVFGGIGFVIESITDGISRFIDMAKKAIDIAKEFLSSDFEANANVATGNNTSDRASGNSSIRGQKANGGSVMGGSSYLVGEKGPEMFTPSSNGNVSAGGGNSVTVNINGTTDPDTIMRKVVEVLSQQGVVRR